MFHLVVVIVLGIFITNRNISWVLMEFIKGTLWKTSMKGQLCMKNITSELDR